MTVDGTAMPLASVSIVVSLISLSVSLSNVYHILNLTLNFSYVGQLCESGNLVTFSSFYCFV